MKSFLILIVSAALTLPWFNSIVQGQEAEPESGILPVRPQQLWASMPGKLKTWKLLRSTGENRLGGWIESRAVREYEKIVPPENSPDPNSEPSPPATARLVITDTGKHPSAISRFADFSTDSEPESDTVAAKRIQSWPAYLITFGEEDQTLEILVAGRFLVEISITHQPEKFLDEWVRRVDLAALAKIPDTETVPLPDRLIMVKLDQLKPARNRAYRLATTSSARQETELIEDETVMAELLGEVPDIPEESEEDDSR